MAEMPAFPVIVTHLEDAPGSGLAACSGRPFRTPGGFSNFARWLCTGCARYARPEPLEGDAGECPTCHSSRCVGRLQYENCNLGEYDDDE